ncbi:hypothetical protein ACE1TF_03085 [Geomicrobium sp. JSM 1781026]|uniref:response regulator aspartate phosphatase n=1 Tax=Geomicrobium sp. JSM 1781026 TaxID=3344580 RepID=UPI0035C16AB2
MSSYVSPADLVSTIGNWYHAIIRRDVEAATRLKKVVEELMARGKIDEEIELYYELTDFRHMMITENISEGEAYRKIDKLQDLGKVNVNSTFRSLQNYIYGHFEFLQGSYIKAIRYYQETEFELNQLSDPFEKADFYQRMGETYYRIDQYVSSIYYLEKSFSIFNENPLFEERALNSLLLLGCVYSEMRETDEAKELFDRVLNSSKSYPTLHSLALRNIGLSLLQSNHLKSAKRNFLEALETGGHKNSAEGMKTKYNISLICFRLDDYEEGLNYLNIAMYEADKYHSTEYIARCKIVQNLYVKKDLAVVIEGLNQLEANNLYFECAEMSNEVSYYMERVGENEQAFSFLKKSLEYRNFQLKSRSDIS